MEGIRTGIGKLLRRFGYSLKKVDGRDTIPLTDANAGRLLYFDRLMKLVNDIDGAIVECGVGDGDSLLMLALLAQAEGSAREIWAFDSFEGFPEPGPHDGSPRRPEKGQLARSISDVRKRLLDGGVSQHYFSTKMVLISRRTRLSPPSNSGRSRAFRRTRARGLWPPRSIVRSTGCAAAECSSASTRSSVASSKPSRNWPWRIPTLQ